MNELPQGWEEALPLYAETEPAIATRIASERAIQAIAAKLPNWLGGSADLESSTMTRIASSGHLSRDDYSLRNICFGVREFAMGAVMNGMLLHQGVRVFAGTFLVFSDYMRPAIRLAAIMKLPAVYVFTHDSIAVGEDGPTHEPVEQLASLRSIPGLTVLRPADANETSAAWRYAVNASGPCALVLSRQPLPVLPGTARLTQDGCVERGAYVLSEAPGPEADAGKPQAQLIATGSEVQLALEAQKLLAAEGIPVRVISMPSCELFERQPAPYRESVLLPDVEVTVAVEMGASQGWHRYTGRKGAVVSVDRFGASAPAAVLMEEYGFTAGHVAARVKSLL
jgi:transketolase